MSKQTSAAQSAPAGEREAFDAWFDESVKPSVSYGSPDILRRSNLPAFQAGAAWQRAQSAANDSHDFKNFHRLLCERFGYTHDEKDWRRDQLSLIEWIAKQSAGVPGTPGASWRANGELDPHGDRYNCERAALAMGDLTDDELANGAFMNYDRPLNIEGILAGTHSSPIAWMTAVKDRIRWLSRKLDEALAAAPAHPAERQEQEEVQRLRVHVCKLGRYGAAFDPASTHYAYTYTDQPENLGAAKLGRAALGINPGGDLIDAGLSLLDRLSREGFGVFQIAASTGQEV